MKTILFVDGFHHNLISESSLCDNQVIVEFIRIGCIRNNKSAPRRKKNTYLEEIRNYGVCLLTNYKENDVDLWHRR